MDSKLNQLADIVASPKGFASISACIAGSLFAAKFISKTYNATQKAAKNPNSDVESHGYDTLIPFTVKQNMTPVIKNGEKFGTVEHERIPKDMQLKRSRDLFTFANMRRSFRHFSNEPVDIEVIRNCIATANTAPSGAHTSPWTFVVVTNKVYRSCFCDLI